MENKAKILDLFPTPLYIHQVPPNLSKVVKYLNSQEMTEEGTDVNNYGSHSSNTYILNDPPCLELSNFILSEAQKFGDEILNYQYNKYKFSQSWISYKHPGQSHSKHTHPNSLISGIFYYGVYDKTTPQVLIFPPSQPHPTHPKINPDLMNKYSNPICSIIPTSGMLLLFSSNIPHSVPLNTSQQIRKSLAFNIVPTEGLGDERSLTQLKFN